MPNDHRARARLLPHSSPNGDRADTCLLLFTHYANGAGTCLLIFTQMGIKQVLVFSCLHLTTVLFPVLSLHFRQNRYCSFSTRLLLFTPNGDRADTFVLLFILVIEALVFSFYTLMVIDYRHSFFPLFFTLMVIELVLTFFLFYT